MLFDKIKQFFKPPEEYKPPEKTLADLDLLDTVWIKDNNGVILEGWIFEINKKHIIVVVQLENKQFIDFRYVITRPLTQTKLKQNHTILFLNKPCAQEI